MEQTKNEIYRELIDLGYGEIWTAGFSLKLAMVIFDVYYCNLDNQKELKSIISKHLSL